MRPKSRIKAKTRTVDEYLEALSNDKRWFGASVNHCSFYPGAVVEAHKEELKDFDTSKGTIRFQANNRLPATLVRKLVRARVAKNAAQQRQSAAGACRR
jgi:uncharacterized protein YdhG (YjbR/CyaY superfamily)